MQLHMLLYKGQVNLTHSKAIHYGIAETQQIRQLTRVFSCTRSNYQHSQIDRDHPCLTRAIQHGENWIQKIVN